MDYENHIPVFASFYPLIVPYQTLLVFFHNLHNYGDPVHFHHASTLSYTAALICYSSYCAKIGRIAIFMITKAPFIGQCQLHLSLYSICPALLITIVQILLYRF